MDGNQKEMKMQDTEIHQEREPYEEHEMHKGQAADPEKDSVWGEAGTRLPDFSEKRKQIWKMGRLKEVCHQYPIFLGLSLMFGLIYAWCVYENPHSMVYPVLVLAQYGIMSVLMRRVSVPLKKDACFFPVVALLLALSMGFTMDEFVLVINKIGINLLFMLFVLHHFYDDRVWNIGKYGSALFQYLGASIACCGYPFIQGSYFMKKFDLRKYKNIKLVLMGLLASVPLLITVTILLGEADVVFQNMIGSWMDKFLNFGTIFTVIYLAAVGSMTMYCMICGACKENIKKEVKNVRNQEPVIAITCLGLTSLLYLLFCGIQIYYLFLGKGELPEGMTYSSYAREGFFQLLFVALCNLTMVLLCLKYFKASRLLDLVLTMICGCTYIMVFSAAYRMIGYVREYHLTYLRVLVLWFLALLAVLFLGVVLLIYKNRFPLFRYCLAVISVFYLGFAWSRPEVVIARYNVQYLREWTDADYEYMFQSLSPDALPVIINAMEEAQKKDGRQYYQITLENGNYFITYPLQEGYWDTVRYLDIKSGIRTFNMSYWKMLKTMERYAEKS